MSEQNLNAEEHIRRLRWHCRRGIKEVEVLLVPFFEERYTQLNPQDQQRFELLLEQHDVDMFEWFTHRSKPEDPDLAHIVSLVLSRVGS
ncbi:succinate dehydrogenase assembly factor 2 [Ketobacter sp.]|uniref:FAD assembly factor SdhE n=1 Tax=Ketobacter sp. TaxID=2083498 RepID=UPI000F18EA91|nr:succinate dehydrogenase assembly factor 2 [Ketobacter sp.]RLT94458.1 MAG: succinate dehydrogenase assembly factor 2 family protein [Ketobacter sp.]